MQWTHKKATLLYGVVFLLLFVIMASCDKSEKANSASSQESKRGKVVYMANCIACHNMNPLKDGSLGPATAGSSLELLQLRVVEGTYPNGYTPKRNTNLMQPFPQLVSDIPALHAFLAQ